MGASMGSKDKQWSFSECAALCKARCSVCVWGGGGPSGQGHVVYLIKGLLYCGPRAPRDLGTVAGHVVVVSFKKIFDLKLASRN